MPLSFEISYLAALVICAPESFQEREPRTCSRRIS